MGKRSKREAGSHARAFASQRGAPLSPEMTMLPPRNVQMLIVLTERNGLVASIN